MKDFNDEEFERECMASEAVFKFCLCIIVACILILIIAIVAGLLTLFGF